MATTAAALVIGNELLTGKIKEENLSLLARELFELGIELRRVVFCQDVVDTIADDIRALRADHDYVITSGGVGPTHDDVTIKAVARSFGKPVVRSSELEHKIRELVGERCTAGHLRMADIPEGANLVATDEAPWPTVLMENVFVLPGLPRAFQMKLPVLRAHIKARRPFVSRAIYTQCRETDITELLDRLDADHPEVAIGSYPVHGENYRVRLTFDSKEAAAVERAVGDLLEQLPPEKIVDV